MCEPVTIMATAAALGTAMTAYSSYESGQYAKDMGNRNAQVEQMKSEESAKQGAIAEEQQRTHTRQVMGAQRAAMGGSGLEVDSGSNGAMLEDTAKFGELDAQTVQSNAAKQSWGYDISASSERTQGAMAAKAGTMNSFGTLLSGAAQAYGMSGAGTKLGPGMTRLNGYRNGSIKLS